MQKYSPFCGKWTVFFVILTLLFAHGVSAADGDSVEGDNVDGANVDGGDIDGDTMETEDTGSISFGGSFFSTFTALWEWNDEISQPEQLFSPDEDELLIDLGANLNFDARPNPHFRAFGNVKLFYPFNVETDLNEQLPDHSFVANNIVVTELYSQFDWKNILYFQVGKTRIPWGRGYFFNPADVINPGYIDPLDPEADPEGPVFAMIQVPFSILEISFYVSTENALDPHEVGIAPKVVLDISPVTVEAGAYYQIDEGINPSISVTLELWHFDIYTQGVITYGTRRNLLEESDSSTIFPQGISVVQRDEKVFFSSSTGVKFREPTLKLTARAEYYYNGFGSGSESVIENGGLDLLLIQERVTEEELLYRGEHYVAGLLEWELFNTGLTPSVTGIVGLSAPSAKVIPTLSWSPFQYLEIGISVPMEFGEPGGEFSPDATNFGFGFYLTLGSGSF